MNLVEGRVLGIDYGSKRIGIAISDPTQVLAQGITTVTARSAAKAISEIGRIIEEYDIVKMVVGLPLTLKGELGATALAAKKFAARLNREYPMPVHWIDERFTSKIAEQTLKMAGVSPAKNKARVDQISATLILQSYLDNQSLNKSESHV